MDPILCFIFMSLSFATLAAFVITAIARYKRTYFKRKGLLNSVTLVTVGVFIAVLFSFIPIFYSAVD